MKQMQWGKIFDEAIAKTSYTSDDTECLEVYTEVVKHLQCDMLKHVLSSEEGSFNKEFRRAVLNEVTERAILGSIE